MFQDSDVQLVARERVETSVKDSAKIFFEIAKVGLRFKRLDITVLQTSTEQFHFFTMIDFS